MNIRAFKIDVEGGYSAKEWFEMSIRAFKDIAPSLEFEDFDFVQLVPRCSYRRYFSGNDGAQGWRHRRSGWTIPDYCRQVGGCPEMWTRTKKRNLEIPGASPILCYMLVH